MEFKQIEYFVRVAELGSFTKASIALDVAQSALSRQVRLLEVELGKNLLIRNGRGVTLTDAGRVLLEHGRGLMHQIDHLHEKLAREQAGLVGKVALGLPSSLSKSLIVPLLRCFREELPDAVISIGEGLSLHMQEAIINGRLDVAVMYDVNQSPDIELRPVFQQSLYLVQRRVDAAEEGPVDLKDLVNIPLVIPRRPNIIRMHVESALSNIGLHPSVAIEVDVVSAIMDLILEGEGSAILPYYTIHAYGGLENFTVRLIENPPIATNLFIAVSAHRPLTKVQKNLIEIVTKKLHELVDR
jgi:LysR family transcriptional regulator, nitrogen assimilation regulatory protein